MRTALAWIGAALAIVFVAGFLCALGLVAAVPVLTRWAARRVAKAELVNAGNWPPIDKSRLPPPPPAPDPPAGLRRQRTRVRGRAISKEIN